MEGSLSLSGEKRKGSLTTNSKSKDRQGISFPLEGGFSLHLLRGTRPRSASKIEIFQYRRKRKKKLRKRMSPLKCITFSYPKKKKNLLLPFGKGTYREQSSMGGGKSYHLIKKKSLPQDDSGKKKRTCPGRAHLLQEKKA